MQTKARITIGVNSVEVEGTEEFVVKTLTEFRELVTKRNLLAIVADEPEEKQTSRKTPKVKAGKASSKASKTITAEKFEVHKSADHLSLEEFLKQKQPGNSATSRIVVIGYFINRILNQPKFTEGNIDYAYRVLQLTGRPKHLRQILINLKNDKDWFDMDEDGDWQVTRTGEIFVEEKLPPESK